jgi:hypothetical protein
LSAIYLIGSDTGQATLINRSIADEIMINGTNSKLRILLTEIGDRTTISHRFGP